MKRTEMVSINNVEPCDDSRVHPNTAEQDNRSSPATATANSTATATAGLFRGPRPKNQWTDNLFNCKNNCYPSWFCVQCCCYGVWLQAQMAHKLRMANFWTILYIFFPYWIFAIILQINYSDQFYIMQSMVFVFALVLSLFIRSRIVAIDNINGNNQYRECCIGFWCMPCSVAQMARHLYGYKKRLDGDADPERPDNYETPKDADLV